MATTLMDTPTTISIPPGITMADSAENTNQQKPVIDTINKINSTSTVKWPTRLVIFSHPIWF